MDHDYGEATKDRSVKPQTSSTSQIPLIPEKPPLSLLLKLKERVELFLPKRWMVIADHDKLHVVLVSLQKSAVIQRSVIAHPGGGVEIYVHAQPMDCNPHTSDLDPPAPLNEDNVNDHVDRIVAIVSSVHNMAICSGYDDIEFQPGWSTCPFGEVDKNIFQECRYVETFRSVHCTRLVTSKKWRCTECQKMYHPLFRRTEAAAVEERHANTPNIYLTERQRLKKLKDLKKEAENLRKKNMRLHERIQECIQREGIQIDNALSDDLTGLINNSDMSPEQSIFLQQQVKASQLKNSCGMRWHPTMIRFALSLHLTSPAAYELVRQTGMVALPSGTTLFDYTHVKPAEEGVDKVVLESLEARVGKFDEKHKKYHVLMMDEMYISQNLVFQKSRGKLMGYTSLDTIESEMKNMEKWIDATEEVEPDEAVASKVLVYMVKGVSNGIKEVVATYAVATLSANQLYDWTWHIIGDLERHGIAVVAVVCDGSSVNRAFIKKHKPATVHPSGIIFDTWNKAARGRKLYFLSDVPHLLKTIRNCFLNSRWDNKKSRRKLIKNGKKITWDFVIKLYELKKHKTLRKSYKLNAQNVYPDSYARMRVNLAGQVLSTTVAKDMDSQGWSSAKETVTFIQKVNDWFDCLNGAHSTQGRKKRNENLKPYTSKDDPRFSILDDFLKYLDEWQIDAENVNQSINATLNADNSMNVDTPDGDTSDIESAAYDPETDTAVSKKLLSRETLEGIRMSTLAFKPLVHFLLDEGASFINARVFTQDPLEQHFSKVRAGQGGSTNPNLVQVLNRNRVLHTVGQLGMRKRKGNSGQEARVVEVTHEPLPKRKCNRVPKFTKVQEVTVS